MQPKANRKAKDTVFLDMFADKQYLLQMFQTLHPEMVDITEEDLEIITMRPVLLDLPYNDLAFMAKDKLMIFVEAQSTWTENILLRLLMYYAQTLKEYIEEHGHDVYHKKKVPVGEPEFYVVYSGNEKKAKPAISLKKDFFENSRCKIDLEAKVIYQEDKSNIIGQYIIFCHVFDEQTEKWGSVKKAVEETIRICRDENILKEYLTSREKEVVEIMNLLFDQEYAMERRMMSREIAAAVETYQDCGISKKDTVNRIAKKYNLDESDAEWYVDASWKEPAFA